MKFDCIEKRLRLLFSHHGQLITKHPSPSLIFPVLITGILTTGVFLYFTKETDPEILYSPEGSESHRNRVLIEELYSSVVDENMLARHRTRSNCWASLIILPNNGTNVLAPAVVNEVLRLHDLVMNVTIQRNSKDYKYVDLCMMWKGTCYGNNLLNILNDDPLQVGNINFTYPMNLKNDGDLLFIGSELGGVTLNAQTEVERASAMKLSYLLRYDTEEEREKGLMWEEEFLHEVADFKTQELTIYRRAESSVEVELDKSSGIPSVSLVIVGIVIGTFAVLSTNVFDWVRNKPILACLGAFSAGLALASTFGLMSYAGVAYANVAGVVPFLVIGIGVDDMFILISAWRQTSVYKSTADRMKECMEEAAMSITITSVTDALAFGIGCISQFYSIRLLCMYATVAVVLVYVYMITFFAGCMVLSGYREEKNRHALTLRKVLPKEDAQSKAYRLFCAGGSSEESVKKPSSTTSDSIWMIFFQKHFGPFITHPVSAIGVCLFYALYLGVAIWGVLCLQEGLEFSNVVDDSSYLHAYLESETSYFNVFGPDMSVVAFEELEYWDTSIQTEIENTLTELEGSKYFHDLTISWLREYLHFLNQSGIISPSKTVFLRTLREQFLTLPMYEQFTPDIIFDATNNSIISSRFYVVGKNLDDTTRQRDMFLKIRQVLADSPLNLKAFHFLAASNLEQYIAIRQNSILIVSIGLVVMFVTSLVFIPSPICAILVTLSAMSTVLGLIGFMAHAKVSLNSISMISLVPALGFSVDFSAHMSYACVSAHGDSRRKKSIHALYSLGTPILQCATSTILAVCIVATSDNYIFRTFLATSVLTICIGAVHALIFLPVFLMLFVPIKTNINCETTKSTDASVEKNPTENGLVNPAFCGHYNGVAQETKGTLHWQSRRLQPGLDAR